MLLIATTSWIMNGLKFAVMCKLDHIKKGDEWY